MLCKWYLTKLVGAIFLFAQRCKFVWLTFLFEGTMSRCIFSLTRVREWEGMPLGVLIPFPNNALCVPLLRKDIFEKFPFVFIFRGCNCFKKTWHEIFSAFQGKKIIGSFVLCASEADWQQSCFEVYLKTRIWLDFVHWAKSTNPYLVLFQFFFILYATDTPLVQWSMFM